MRANNPVEENLFDELSGSRRLLNDWILNFYGDLDVLYRVEILFRLGGVGIFARAQLSICQKCANLTQGTWPCRLLATTF